MKISLDEGKVVVISEKSVEKLLDLKDELALRLYIYISQKDGNIDPQIAADRLGTSVDSVMSALNVLCKASLAQNEGERKILDRGDTIPEYTVNDVSKTLESDKSFSALLDFTQQKLGKMLSTVDTQTLLGIYSWMGLPVEVIFLIITHCIEECEKKYGAGRRPTMKNIENQARIWLNMGILTAAQAEDYLRTREERGKKIATITRLLHITGRALSATEHKYLTAWADEGYSEEVLMEAYDITVVQTGKLNWRYMDKVLKNWASAGIKSKKDIEKARNEEKKDGFKMSAEQIEAFRKAEELSKKWGSGN